MADSDMADTSALADKYDNPDDRREGEALLRAAGLIELPSLEGLPEGPWRYQEQSDAYTHIVRGTGNHFIIQCGQSTKGDQEKLARAIAAIPDMVRELTEFRKLKEYAKSLGQETYLELHAENDRLRALNDELVEALVEARHALEWYEQEKTGESYNNIMINAILAKAKSQP
jgi:hypothetical protein